MGVDKFKEKINGTHADGPVSQPHAGRDGRWHRHQQLADLKGKRVSTGSPGSGVEVMALRVLDAMGLDPKKDIKQERLGAAESVNAIKDRKIDAFFWVGGVPTAALTDLAATPGIKMKLLDHAQYVDAMNKKYGPLYVKATIAPKQLRRPGQASRQHRRLEHPRRLTTR